MLILPLSDIGALGLSFPKLAPVWGSAISYLDNLSIL